MPELPEVETIRQDLRKAILNKKIVDVEVRKSKLVKNKLTFFKKELLNKRIVEIDRIGKLLIRRFDRFFLIIHLRMTGQLIYSSKKGLIAGGHSHTDPNQFNLPNKHSHIIIKFSDGSQLYFNDLRQFGFMQILSDKEISKIRDNYGIEPLSYNFSWDCFYLLARKKKIAVKTFLLNQKLISGIGNIYADEICFAAGIQPQQVICKLSKVKLKLLFKSCNDIIKKGIKHRGTTFSDYVDSRGNKGNYSKYLKVYGRKGQYCLNCKTVKIIKIKFMGRGTHYCPLCQEK